MLIKKVFNLLKSFIIMILLFSFCRLIPSESIDTIEDTNTVLKANQNKTTSDTIDSIVNSSAIQTEISYDMIKLNVMINDRSFYYQNSDDSYLYIDAINKDEMINEVLCAKLVLNPSTYFMTKRSALSGLDGLVECLYSESNLYKKIYFVIDNSVKKSLIRQSIQIDDEEVLSRIIRSQSLEISYLFFLSSSNEEHESPNRTIGYGQCTSSCDNQSILDHYINTTAGNFPNYTFQPPVFNNVDDDIVHLIPKRYFTSVGQHYSVGTEWGYYIRTINSGTIKFSQVLVFDIVQIKKDEKNRDTTIIKVAFTQNYYYDNEEGTIKGSGRNYLCLGNPCFSSAIIYDNISSDRNAVSHPNPGDSNYNYLTDYGYSFSDFVFDYVGQGLEYQKNLANVYDGLRYLGSMISNNISNIFSDIMDLLDAYSLSNMILKAAVDIVLSIAEDYLDDYIQKQETQALSINKSENTVYDSQSKKFMFQYLQMENNSNYDSRRLNNNLKKIVTYRTLGKNRSKDISMIDRQKPVLLKDNTDSVTVSKNIISSTREDYTAYITNSIELDLFEDNSTINHQYVDYITSIKGEWGYYYGKDVSSRTKNLYEDTIDAINCYYGSQDDQVVNFNPRKNDYYDISVFGAECDTIMDIYKDGSLHSSIESGSVEEVFQGISIFKSAYSLHYFGMFFSSSSYEIHFRRQTEMSVRYFGSCSIETSIVKSNLNTFSMQTNYMSLQHSSIECDDSNASTRTSFTALESGYYTFIVSPIEDFTGVVDTYMKLCDSNFNEILSSDDVFSGGKAGMVIKLKKNTTYKIKTFLLDLSGRYAIHVYRGSYIPELVGNQYQINTPTGFLNTCNTLLVCFANSRTLYIYTSTNYQTTTDMSVDVYDEEGNMIITNTHPYNNSTVITCSSHRFYAIHFRCSVRYDIEHTSMHFVII